jgi:peptide/nickel transport system permease protein
LLARRIVSRLLQMLAVVFFVTLLSFVLVNVLPGDIRRVLLGDSYNEQAAAQLTKELDLNQPLVLRYLHWLGGALHGDLGSSLIAHQSVLKSIMSAAGPTTELVIGAQLFAILLAVIVALASVTFRKPWVDRTGTSLALIASSIPSFVLALLLLALFSVHWHLVSSIGWQAPSSAGWGANLQSMALPCFLLGLSVFPGHMRVFRAELNEQLETEEYVTLARMKGISTWRTMTRHVARNSAFGLITVIAFSTGFLIAGAVLIEQVFSIPGIGSLILNAINNRDSPMVEGCVALLAVFIVLLNLLADIAYAWLDPRVRDGVNA